MRGVIAFALLVGCAQLHGAPLDGETGCGADNPPYVIGTCRSNTYEQGCLDWLLRRAPRSSTTHLLCNDISGFCTSTTGYVACRGGGFRCVRADHCYADGGCTCGDRPECGSGQVCVGLADGGRDCVCGVGPP